MTLFIFAFIAVASAGLAAFDTANFTHTFFDSSRNNRIVNVFVRYPLVVPPFLNIGQSVPLILISHGGEGNCFGFVNTLSHIGEGMAQTGMIAAHVQHCPSTSLALHKQERPKDVSFVISALTNAAGLSLIADKTQLSINTSLIGHIGHSWGAYTGHALAGGKFKQGTFRDDRVKAIVTLSPQGADKMGDEGFGAYLTSPTNNSWQPITIPTLTIAGEVELGGPRPDVAAWRLDPFFNYDATHDAFAAVLPGLDHDDIANSTNANNEYIALNSAAFFTKYLHYRTMAVESTCDILKLYPVPTTFQAVRTAASKSKILGCPALVNVKTSRFW